MARTLQVAGAPEGAQLVAEAGIGHQKEYIRFWKRLAGVRPRDRRSLASAGNSAVAPNGRWCYRCLTRSQRRVRSRLSA